MNAQSAGERSGQGRRAAAVRTKAADAAGVASKPSVSACDDLQVLIAKRAYEFYAGRGCQDGHALDDRLEAEREVLSQVPPVSLE